VSDRIRVLLYHRAQDADVERLLVAYRRVAAELRGTPGLLQDELLRSTLDPDAFVLLSEWESMAAFREWESRPDHRATTAPLRPYRDVTLSRPFEVYAVRSSS
jgi:heme oxygenase (mycobilin-producing)